MSKNQQFQKFITYKSNAAKKEQFKQEKRSAKKERAAAIDKRFEEKRRKRELGGNSPESGVNSQKSGLPSKKSKDGGIHLRVNKEQNGDEAKKPISENQRQQRNPNNEKDTLQQGGNRHQASPLAAKANDTTLKAKDKDHMPLNKYVAHSGVCSRRDAAELIRKGEVSVNGAVITEPGTKVSARDTVTIKGKKLTPSKNMVYILLNKPKDYITTLDDPEGRKTVLDLVKRASDERVYPVGRLDRNTSGVLLITNDGELAQTLSHPSNLIKKIYEVRLDKQLTKADFEKLQVGLTLDDGFIMPDALGYTNPKDKTIIGIEIHSGRNRIVRRIFEHLGYDVRNLDRVTYAGLTKKNVQRGKWRFLTEKEVRILRHFNPQTKKDKVKKPLPAPAKISKKL